jgi:SAM-dependent methyltransferase
MDFPIQNGVPIFLNREEGWMGQGASKEKVPTEMEAIYARQTIFYKLLKVGRKWINAEYIPKFPKKVGEFFYQESSLRILEIGSGVRKINPNVVNLDIGLFNNVDVVGDGHHLPFLDNSFDGVVIEVVLEHIREPEKVISEIHRVLKRDGYVYSVVPFMHPYHGYPGDYRRFSIEGIELLFHRFEKEELGVLRGPGVAMLNLLTTVPFLFTFSKSEKVFYITKGMSLCFLFPIKFLDKLLIRNSQCHRLADTFYYLGRAIK